MKLSGILKSSALVVALLAVSNASKAQTSLNMTVDFGTPPEGGGACSGKGLCTAKPTVEDVNTGTTSEVGVLFSLSADRNVLTLTFSKSELDMKQPGQSVFINAAATDYYFDGLCDLTDPKYAPLNLKAGAKIGPGTYNTLSITGDVVTISYIYVHY